MQIAGNDYRITGCCVEICDPCLCCVLCYEAAMMIRCRDTQGSTRCGRLDHINDSYGMVVDVNFLVIHIESGDSKSKILKVLLYLEGPPKL